MEITFQTKTDTAISICIGYQTNTHSSSYFITVCRVWYDEDHRVEFAKSLINWFKNPKYWKFKLN